MFSQEDQSTRGFGAGVFIGLAIVLPVFAATTPELEQWALPFTFAATTLVVVGLALAALGLRDVNRDGPPIPVRRQASAARPAHIRKERRLGHEPARQLG